MNIGKNLKGVRDLFSISRKKLFFGTIVSIGFIFIIFFIFKKYIPRPLVDKQNQQALSAEDIKDWKTYDSALFSYKYPPDFLVRNIRNAVMIWGPAEEIDRQFFQRTNEGTIVEPVKNIVISNKDALMRRVVNDYIYLGDAERSFADVVYQIAIKDVRYYRDGQWFEDGFLYLDIHVDGDNPDADVIADAITNSIKINEVSNNDEMITKKIGKMEVQVSATWWFECLQNDDKIVVKCKIDTVSNTQPHRPAEFYINYFPLGEEAISLIDESILTNILRRPITITGVSGTYLTGAVDPLKYSEGSAWYGQNSRVRVVRIQTDGGVYLFSSVIATDQIGKDFDKILSSFRFE